jgi:hypothetical protein
MRILRRFRESEAGRHFRNARREALLGIKALIEAGIERLEAVEEKAEPQQAHKVEIN